jgi:hypothetical protein
LAWGAALAKGGESGPRRLFFFDPRAVRWSSAFRRLLAQNHLKAELQPKAFDKTRLNEISLFVVLIYGIGPIIRSPMCVSQQPAE